MPRSVLALMSFGSILERLLVPLRRLLNRSASKYMLASWTRVAASRGFCCAVVLSADARASSSGGGAGCPCDAVAGADAAAAGADEGAGAPACWLPMIQPTRSPKKHAGHAEDEESLFTVRVSVCLL